MKTVLLTNGQQRKTLAAARSLGEKGIKVISGEETRFNITGFSKYCSKSLVYPNIKGNPEKFYQWLVDTIKKYKCDVLFPMDDDSMDVVMKNYEEISSLCNVFLPPIESYKILEDKSGQADIVKEAGVDLPKTYKLKEVSECEILADDLTYPVVIKPRKSSGSRGIRIIDNKEEFVTTYKAIHKQYPLPIVQEYIGYGERYDVCLLFDEDGENAAAFVQKEIRHFPVDIGPSTVQKSVDFPELIEKSLEIMKRVKWRGIVELEYMVDERDGKLKFMEINPRFWASLYTAIISGVDFPYLLYKLSLGEKIDKVSDYKTELYCRWTLPGDMFHFLTNKDRKNAKPSFLAGREKQVYDDIIAKDDFMPVIGFIMACLRYGFDFKMWSFIFKR